MKTLHIDTRDNTKVTAVLIVDGKEFKSVSTSENRHPESILTLIDDVCNQAGINVTDIEDIKVEEGPGSYTGLKVGASVANALSFALNKPVNGKKGEIVEPKYE